MVTVYLVRHGEAPSYAENIDPGLTELGRRQAEATSRKLAQLEPVAIFSSPIRRARETAEFLGEQWHAEVTIEGRISEIPSPTDILGQRSAWLKVVMDGNWRDLPPNLLRWRHDLIDCVIGQTRDCVMFSHFVAINLIVGFALAQPSMVVFRPNNASVTTVRNDCGNVQIIELGAEADTRVN